jgi:hypothetical protein
MIDIQNTDRLYVTRAHLRLRPEQAAMKYAPTPTRIEVRIEGLIVGNEFRVRLPSRRGKDGSTKLRFR